MANQNRCRAVRFGTDTASRPIVVFVHGFLDAAKVWETVQARLGAAGISTRALDLPGMGGTPSDSASISLDSYADAVGSVVKTLGAPVTLVGHSMGAQVAELVALRYADLVEGIVLVTPVPLAGVRAPAEIVTPFKAVAGDFAAQRELRCSLSYDMQPADLDRLAQFGVGVAPDVVSKLVDVWNSGHPDGETASRYTGRVLLIRGASDPFADAKMIGRVARRFPRADLATVERAGHWAHVEQPDAVTNLILEDLETLQRQPNGGTMIKEDSNAHDWTDAFAQRTAEGFADAFAENVVLEATTLVNPVQGRENVKQVMSAASKIYKSLEFTKAVSAGDKQFLEWVAEAHAGVKFRGVTVLTRDATGSIVHAAIHHRPMRAAMFFSELLGKNLRGVIGPEHFLGERVVE
jgi:pimeloyl-ACP methyl ester carboxylesterase